VSAVNAGIRLLVRNPGRTRIVLVVLLLSAATSVPQLGTTFMVSLACNILIFGLLAMSLDLLGGYAGLVSLGQASFLGVGAYGVAAAAQTYWDKALSELTLADCAYLATLPKAPSNYDPFKFPDRAVARRHPSAAARAAAASGARIGTSRRALIGRVAP